MRRRTLPLVALLLFPLLLPAHRARGGDNVVRVIAVGDIMMGTTFPEDILPPQDGETLFAGVRPLLARGDVVFGTLEGALTEGGRSPKCGDWKPKPGGRPCFAFRTPPRYAFYLTEAGFNVMNVANNHSLDFGLDGMDNTLAALDNAGIQACGGERVARFTVGGTRVAVAGFSYSYPTRYVYPVLDIPRAREIVSNLKTGSDIVIVSFHGGAEGAGAQSVRDAEEEFLGEPRGNPVQFAHAVVDAGADLVLGHGPHVPRALEIYRGKLIAYSLGNFVVYSMFNIKGASGLSYVLQAELSAETGDVVAFRTPSVELRNLGIPFPDPEGRAEALLRKLSEEFLERYPDAEARRAALAAAWRGKPLAR